MRHKVSEVCVKVKGQQQYSVFKGPAEYIPPAAVCSWWWLGEQWGVTGLHHSVDTYSDTIPHCQPGFPHVLCTQIDCLNYLSGHIDMKLTVKSSFFKFLLVDYCNICNISCCLLLLPLPYLILSRLFRHVTPNNEDIIKETFISLP